MTSRTGAPGGIKTWFVHQVEVPGSHGTPGSLRIKWYQQTPAHKAPGRGVYRNDTREVVCSLVFLQMHKPKFAECPGHSTRSHVALEEEGHGDRLRL